MAEKTDYLKKKETFDEKCERYRSIFEGWEKMSMAERVKVINRFRAGY